MLAIKCNLSVSSIYYYAVGESVPSDFLLSNNAYKNAISVVLPTDT